jgi:hypothetical protein
MLRPLAVCYQYRYPVTYDNKIVYNLKEKLANREEMRFCFSICKIRNSKIL